MTAIPHVRPATPDDMDAVAAIFSHYVTTSVCTFEEQPPTRTDWLRRLDDLTGQGLPLLVGVVDGQVVGYGCATPWRLKTAYRFTAEDSVYLAPGWTGRGLGSALLRTVLDACARAGVRQVIAVIADTGSDASVALHRRHDFAPVGRLTAVGYKHGCWVDTVLMQHAVSGAAV